MKILLLLFCIFLNSLFLNAATYGGNLNDHGIQILKTSDNGLLLSGDFENISSNDFYLVKLDSAFNLQWTKTFGSDSYESDFDVSEMFDGGYLISGYNLDSLQGTLLRVTANGDSVWSKNYGTDPNTIYINAYSQQISSDLFVVGIASAPFTGGSTLTLCHTDTSGNIIDTIVNANGGNKVLPIVNGFLITGVIAYLNPMAINLVKVDTAANNVITKTYLDPNLGNDFFAYESAELNNGFMTAGYTDYYTQGANEFYLLQTDSNCDSIRHLNWNSGSSELTSIMSAGNYYYLTGHNQTSGVTNNLIYKLDSTGNIIWTKNLGAYQSALSIVEFSPGLFAAVGDSIGANGITDVWLLMFDSTGNTFQNGPTKIATLNAKKSFNIYPTVCHEQLNVKSIYSNDKNYSVEIINNHGILVEKLILNEDGIMDINNYHPGIYFLRIKDKAGNLLSVEKFIKE